MATATETTALQVATRTAHGSREARRLRRRGFVPGVVYGGDDQPLSFEIGARELRQALHHSGAVLDLVVDGGAGSPVVIKEIVRHPVNAEITHLDLLRVRLDVAIEATVPIELTGGEDAPGTREGGVVEQITRELTVEALPNDIPDLVTLDISGMEIGDTLTLESIATGARFQVVDEPDTVIVTITPPRLQIEGDDEIEQETQVVGEDADASAQGSGSDGDGGSDASPSASSSE